MKPARSRPRHHKTALKAVLNVFFSLHHLNGLYLMNTKWYLLWPKIGANWIKIQFSSLVIHYLFIQPTLHADLLSSLTGISVMSYTSHICVLHVKTTAFCFIVREHVILCLRFAFLRFWFLCHGLHRWFSDVCLPQNYIILLFTCRWPLCQFGVVDYIYTCENCIFIQLAPLLGNNKNHFVFIK